MEPPASFMDAEAVAEDPAVAAPVAAAVAAAPAPVAKPKLKMKMKAKAPVAAPAIKKPKASVKVASVAGGAGKRGRPAIKASKKARKDDSDSESFGDESEDISAGEANSEEDQGPVRIPPHSMLICLLYHFSRSILVLWFLKRFKEAVQARRKARTGRAAAGTSHASPVDIDDSPVLSPARSTNPSPAPVTAYAQDPTGAGTTGGVPADVAGGYAVDVSRLLQNAKDYKQAGLLDLNNVLHKAVTQVKGSMHADRRKLLEFGPLILAMCLLFSTFGIQ